MAVFSCQVHQNRTRVVEDLVVADDEAGDFAARVDFQVLWRVLLVGLQQLKSSIVERNPVESLD
jgi:hypothetical protein